MALEDGSREAWAVPKGFHGEERKQPEVEARADRSPAAWWPLAGHLAGTVPAQGGCSGLKDGEEGAGSPAEAPEAG